MISRLLGLNHRERHTFYFAVFSYLLNGITLGILILQEVVLKKTLMGTPLEITLLTMIAPFSNFFSIYFSRIIKTDPNKKRLFLLIGIIGRMSLTVIAFVNSAIPFLLVLFVFYIFNAFLNPLMSSLMQVNIDNNKRGKLFGYMNSVSTIASIIISFAAGRLLDIDDNYFRMLFASAGIIGFASMFFLSRIRFRKKPMADGGLKSSKMNILYPFRNMIYIYSNDRRYLFFEIAFFVYGMGFLVVLPALPIYFVDVMQMDYSQISMAKGVIGQLFMALIMPFIGSLHDRTNPVIFSSITFFILAFYPLILLLAPGNTALNPVHVVYLGFLIYSFAMSAVIIVWNLGSIYFAGHRDSSDYQSIHVTMTGIRGLIAPLVGFAVIKIFGIMQVFVLSSLFFFAASFLMILVFFYCRSGRGKQHQAA